MARTPLHLPRRGFLLGALAAGIAPIAGALHPPLRVGASGPAAPAGSAASLGPLINIPQTYNNCGPAAIAEVLAYWGIPRTQGQVRAALRVDGPVVGMTPYGVPSYARGLGLRALMGVGGTDRLVRALIDRRFPVIVHDVVGPGDDTGHWRPVEGYDDAAGVFVTSDPLLGPGYRLAYGTFAHLWARRGYAFIVLYPRSRAAALAAAVASSGWDKVAAYTRDLALLEASAWDTSPASAPASSADAYRYLALAWDEAQLGRVSSARAYLQRAALAGANPILVRMIGAVGG